MLKRAQLKRVCCSPTQSCFCFLVRTGEWVKRATLWWISLCTLAHVSNFLLVNCVALWISIRAYKIFESVENFRSRAEKRDPLTDRVALHVFEVFDRFDRLFKISERTLMHHNYYSLKNSNLLALLHPFPQQLFQPSCASLRVCHLLHHFHLKVLALL